ncbi:hypothetical protein CYD30_26770 [Kosakonia cowanii]|nr:hypothetical protein CYD30_26770 [Kosakonia cowanii]
MIQEGSVTPPPVCWPEGDIFFRTGVSGLSCRLKYSGSAGGYCFINLNGYTLRSFIDDFPDIKNTNIVIISSPRLMPLATFWLAESRRVRAVFSSGTSVAEIIFRLNAAGTCGKKVWPRLSPDRQLSFRDVRLLNYYFNGVSKVHLQKTYRRAYSTLKGWEASLTRKFCVRKLHYLFLLR